MKKIGLLLGGLCIPLAFCGLGKVLIKQGAAEKKRTADFLPTDAVIESIERVGSDSHDVTISYAVDGQPYITEFNEYSSSYYVGKSLPILYNPAQPAEIIGAGRWGEKLLFLFGTFFIGIGAASAIGLTAVWLREQKKTENRLTAPQAPYMPPVRVSAIPQPVQQLPPAPPQQIPLQNPQMYAPQQMPVQSPQMYAPQQMPVQSPQPYAAQSMPAQPERWPEATSPARIVSSYSDEDAFRQQESGEESSARLGNES